MAGAAPLPMRRDLFQDLSLPSQPRDRSRPLAEILADEGIARGRRVGVVGWKTYAEPVADRGAGVPRGRAPRRWSGPTGSVDERRRAAHRPGRRAADHQRGRAARGVRVRVVPDVGRACAGCCRWPARPGMTEHEAVRLLRWNGDAALVPPDADRRAARDPRPAEPRRPADRARRPRSRRRSASGAR